MADARARLTSTLATAVIWGSAAVVAGLFLWLMWDLLLHGTSRLSLAFLLEDPAESGRAGGLGPILVSTMMVLGVCLAAAVPIGLGTAVLLAEFTSVTGGFGRFVRRSLDALAAVPSIVFGLFGNAFFCKTLGLGFSILSGGLTLACMVLPLFIRSAEEGFRAVPRDYRTAAAALGLSRLGTLTHILIPAAAPGVIAGLVLSMGRALAETAALIFTSGYVDRMPDSVLDSGRVLSIHIYDLSMNVPGGEQSAYGTALVLVLLLLLLNGATLWIGRLWSSRKVVMS